MKDAVKPCETAVARFTPALIEIRDVKAAKQARCDWCGKFVGGTNPARIIDVLSPDYWCIAPGSLDTSLSHAAGLSDIAVCHA